MAPVLDELAAKYAGKVKFGRVNVDESPRTAGQHSIRGVPAIYFYNRGVVVDKAIGALPKAEIERRLNSLA
jgi:thioredoxin 1